MQINLLHETLQDLSGLIDKICISFHHCQFAI
jgi:hypothetical protein